MGGANGWVWFLSDVLAISKSRGALGSVDGSFSCFLSSVFWYSCSLSDGDGSYSCLRRVVVLISGVDGGRFYQWGDGVQFYQWSLGVNAGSLRWF